MYCECECVHVCVCVGGGGWLARATLGEYFNNGTQWMLLFRQPSVVGVNLYV